MQFLSLDWSSAELLHCILFIYLIVFFMIYAWSWNQWYEIHHSEIILWVGFEQRFIITMVIEIIADFVLRRMVLGT